MNSHIKNMFTGLWRTIVSFKQLEVSNKNDKGHQHLAKQKNTSANPNLADLLLVGSKIGFDKIEGHTWTHNKWETEEGT